LLLDEGWGSRAEDATRLERVIATATRAIVAEVEGEIVGFGRCISDDESNGYLSMLVVEPTHRRRGIGRLIVESLMGDDPGMTWMLRAGRPGSERFWEAVGFRRSRTAFERPRTA
jgi:GNAT superfamily N-acetyltransferase